MLPVTLPLAHTFSRLNLGPRAVRRALILAALWGALVTIGLTLQSFAQCGGACIDTVAMTGVISVAAGFLMFGPLVAFSRNDR